MLRGSAESHPHVFSIGKVVTVKEQRLQNPFQDERGMFIDPGQNSVRAAMKGHLLAEDAVEGFSAWAIIPNAGELQSSRSEWAQPYEIG